jgi:hypothetical protein
LVLDHQVSQLPSVDQDDALSQVLVPSRLAEG